MAEYLDLTDYEYEGFVAPHAGARIVNVGWLGWRHSVPQGRVDDAVVERLVQWADASKRVWRGFHNCELCDLKSPLRVVRDDGRTGLAEGFVPGSVTLGHSDLWIPGADGITYVAPSLVIHYIVDHGYLPPEGFIAAVEASDVRDSMDVHNEAIDPDGSVPEAFLSRPGLPARDAAELADRLIGEISALDARVAEMLPGAGAEVHRKEVGEAGYAVEVWLSRVRGQAEPDLAITFDVDLSTSDATAGFAVAPSWLETDLESIRDRAWGTEGHHIDRTARYLVERVGVRLRAIVPQMAAR